MEIKSFTTTVNDFFMIANNEISKFDTNKKQFVIPKYQREYKWSEEQVKTLISDINKHEKFLGNIILNEFPNCYEIVDGQQRITTIFLILIALFNKNKLPTSSIRSEEQKQLYKFIKHKDAQQLEHLILKNESIGDEYLTISDNNIEINIIDDNDIYYQRKTFEDIYNIIFQELNVMEDILSFQNKLLDSQLLILVGDTRGRHNDSIEEVFLDINFKSKLLDVSDIFKGYCFKNYANSSHNELKEHWTKVRKYIKEFENLGYTDADGKTCEYIYHYLLSKSDTYGIPANLSINGVHYLENKNHSQTRSILTDMGDYGENIFNFYLKLYDSSYYFEDICSDATQYRNNITEHRVMKKMLITIIKNPKEQYYKLPLFMVIHYLFKHEELKNALSYEGFKKFISNYYAYSFLFVSGNQAKSKTSIDKTIFSELYKFNSGEPAVTVISNLLETTKELRKAYLEDYSQFKTFVDAKAYALYSLMDNYSPQDNFVKLVYEFPEYNKEHLIAHNNTKLNITWEEADNTFTFSLKELLGKTGTKYIATQHKTSTSNYIVLPPDFNGDLGIKDIVSKIEQIKNYYNSGDRIMPKHIEIFICNIENLNEYNTLVSLKEQNRTPDEIKDAYKNFVDKYFDDSNLQVLYAALTEGLKSSFRL